MYIQSLSANQYVPFENWIGKMYSNLRVYKCVLPCEQAPRKLKEWCSCVNEERGIGILEIDGQASWTFCTITTDDKRNEAIYFSWTGKHPVVFNGIFNNMELVQMRVPQLEGEIFSNALSKSDLSGQ